MPWEQTENEIRHRLRDPGKYTRMRTKRLTKGVSAIVGFSADGGSEIQALRFDKAVFTLEEAKAWMSKRAGKFSETDDVAAQLAPGEIELFRAGDHRPFGGGLYSDEDVAEVAASYDPVNEHEAPITLDHKGDEGGPAYGWMETLRKVGHSLVGKPKQVAPELRAAFTEGRYKRVSSEIYTDYKGTGKKYLRAVSFLGAMIPKVKGLALAKFSDDAGPYVSVDLHADPGEDYEPVDLEAMVMEEDVMRRLSNLTYQFNRTVERVLCAPNLDADQKRTEVKRLAGQLDELVGAGVDEMAERESAARGGAADMPDKAPEKGEVQKMVDDAVAAATAKYAEERTALENRLNAAEAANKAMHAEVAGVKRTANLEKIAAFAETWLRDQLITPASRGKGIVSFCEALATVEFDAPTADGKGSEKKNALAWFSEFLRDRAAAVPLGSHAEGGKPDSLDNIDIVGLIGSGNGSGSRLERFAVPANSEPSTVVFAEKCTALLVERRKTDPKFTYEQAARELDAATGFYKRAR